MNGKEMNLIREEGFNFQFNPQACKHCQGRCCNGESGNVFVNKDEIKTMSRFLKIDPSEFIKEYLKKVSYKFSIKEIKTTNNYACVFFDDQQNKCKIYPVRPEQCHTFPFWDYYKDKPEALSKECPGVSFD